MKTVRVAITGLSGSGKTVFITAVVHHLLHWQREQMPDFPRKRERYPVRAKLIPVPAGRRVFPYEENLVLLRKTPPEWPPSTTCASEIHLEMAYRRTKRREDNVYEPHGKWQRLRLELVDYPGEWLVDVPLRKMDFPSWSARVLAESETEERQAHACKWRNELADVRSDTSYDRTRAQRLVTAYKDYLRACRADPRGLVYLQPGRLLMPAELDGRDVLEFCPLPATALTPRPATQPPRLYDVFAQRFDRYRRTVVQPFFDEYFARAQVQVVLLDLFSILKAGLAAYNDHRRCIEDIIGSLRYGRASWLTRTVLQPLGWPASIERTLFVATKADHASPNQHANLKHLLHDLVTTAELHATGRQGDASILTTYVSAMRSTEAVEGVTEVDGRKVTGLRGVILGQDARGEQSIFPGEVPPAFPEDDWNTRACSFPAFRVKGFPRKHGSAGPHINLDTVLGCMLEGEL